jgi:hypothetical protein
MDGVCGEPFWRLRGFCDLPLLGFFMGGVVGPQGHLAMVLSPL